MSNWSDDMQRLYRTAISRGGLVDGPWRAVRHDTKDSVSFGKSGFTEIVDLKGNTVAVILNEAVADLISNVPEMCDPVIRPQEPTESWKPVPRFDDTAIGVDDVHGAYSQGFDRGYEKGFDSGSYGQD